MNCPNLSSGLFVAMEAAGPVEEGFTNSNGSLSALTAGCIGIGLAVAGVSITACDVAEVAAGSGSLDGTAIEVASECCSSPGGRTEPFVVARLGIAFATDAGRR